MLDIHVIAAAVGPDVANALPALHAFTGCDCTSAFVKIGKIKPVKILEKYANFIPIFQNVGTPTFHLKENNLEELNKFVCCLYGRPAYIDVNKVRYDMFKTRYDSKSRKQTFAIQDGIDISLLPPCK